MSEEKQSLYSALFPYRPRVNDRSAVKGEKRGREPLEDFLTSALTDILNRLTQQEMRDVVKNLFLDGNARSAWKTLCDQHKPNTSEQEWRLKWTAQESISRRDRCDIILKDEQGPLLIIEAKIGSGYSRAGNSVSSSNEDRRHLKTDHQLARYGKRLAQNCKTREWPGALVLLTHLTEPPEDFISRAEDKYHVRFTSVCRWSHVVLWLKKLSRKISDSTSKPAHFLASELAEFLEDKHMKSETVTLENLVAAENFVTNGHAAKIAESFSEIRAKLKPALKQLTENKKSQNRGVDYYSDGRVIRDCSVFKKAIALRTIAAKLTLEEFFGTGNQVV
jgi:hypothetical protein